jgi:integrase/recombinase XerC
MNWLDGFVDWLDERVAAQKTIAAYISDVSLYARWFEQVNGTAFSPELMNSTDVRHYRAFTLETERRSAATWNRRRASLGMLCAFFEAELGLKVFSMKRIPRAEEVTQAPRWLNDADRRKVLRALEMDVLAANTPLRLERAIRDQAMCGLMLFAGLRVSEVLGLMAEDIEISERKGLVKVRAGKGGVYRVVPLSKTVREMLCNHLSDRFRAGEFVFSGENGEKLTPRAAQKRLQALSDRLGMPELSPHALRHTSAKSMLDAGAKLTEVQKILGHKRVTTTTRYVQPGMGDLEEAVERGERGAGSW